jgi:GMP synthase (glutamine-hydrolysing)
MAYEKGAAILAVCYGHQLLAEALGGQVGWHPGGLELGTHQIGLDAEAASHPVLAHLPKTFMANLYHSQTVLITPPSATVLGASEHDPHQILAYGDRILSCQFHPEFDLEIIKNFAQPVLEKPPSRKAGRPEGLKVGLPLSETPESASIIGSFASLVLEQETLVDNWGQAHSYQEAGKKNSQPNHFPLAL